MSPKKAIIIVVFLFFIVAISFLILANKKLDISPNANLDNQLDNRAGQADIKKEPVKPEETVEEKINRIIEDAKNDPNSSSDTVRQEVISTINAEIIKQEENKTPEQKEADLKAQEERQRIIDEINNNIRQTQ